MLALSVTVVLSVCACVAFAVLSFKANGHSAALADFVLDDFLYYIEIILYFSKFIKCADGRSAHLQNYVIKFFHFIIIF